MTTTEIANLVKEVRVMRLDPGDVLVVNLGDRPPSEETLHRLRTQFQDALGDYRILFTSGIDEIALLRPEDE